MNLPSDWPRINCWPEWFDTAGAKLLSSEGLEPKPRAADFARGVRVALPANALVVLRFESSGDGSGSESVRR